MKADSFYFCDSKLDIKIKEVKLKEKCGLKIDQLAGRFVMDSLKMQLLDMALRTPVSNLQASVDMDLNAFNEKVPGKMMAQLKGSLGRSDLFLFVGDALPKPMKNRWPYYPMKLEGAFKGNLQRAAFSGVKIDLPTVFQLTSDGAIANMTDMDRFKANINLKAKTYNLGMVTAYAAFYRSISTGRQEARAYAPPVEF